MLPAGGGWAVPQCRNVFEHSEGMNRNEVIARKFRQVSGAELAAALPQLRPFTHEVRDDVDKAFLSWLSGSSHVYATWQEAFNAWTGATEHHSGVVRVTPSRCATCHGRRVDMRRGTICATCLGGARRPAEVRTAATHFAATAANNHRGATPRQLPAAGDRIRMVGVMADDPDPLPVGATGTVTHVVVTGLSGPGRVQIWVDWDDSQRTLMVLGSDPYEVIDHPEPAEPAST